MPIDSQGKSAGVPLARRPVAGVYAFEEIDDALLLIPLAARRVLDALGRKLSLEAWVSLPVEDRLRIVQAGAGERVDGSVVELLDRSAPRATRIPTQLEPDEGVVPVALEAALGRARPLDGRRWRELRALDRYALAKYASKPEKLAHLYDEIVGVKLSHLTRAGQAHMVNVANKQETMRRAVASARIRTTRGVLAAIHSAELPKGDVLAAARIAGILAAKRVPELVPLCHPVRTTHAAVEFDAVPDRGELHVRSIVEAVDRTGVEMEAMTAVAVAALTVYDMIKSADRWATIDAVRLEAKSGGKSGDVARPEERQ